MKHEVFPQLVQYSNFYELLSSNIFAFISIGTRSIINIDSYVYSSMQGTLESINDILKKEKINDSYALLRKYYDAAIINIYTNLYLDDNFSNENMIVEKIDNWLRGIDQLPDIRTMNNYIQKSTKVTNIYRLLHKDKRYADLRDRCNDHTHYNFYFNVLLNDGKINIRNRSIIMDKFSKDLEDIFVLHFSYLFYINEHYMMSTDYFDDLDCGLTPEPNSQYMVSPFVQEIFDKVIKKSRMDLAMEIKNKTCMMLM